MLLIRFETIKYLHVEGGSRRGRPGGQERLGVWALPQATERVGKPHTCALIILWFSKLVASDKHGLVMSSLGYLIYVPSMCQL